MQQADDASAMLRATRTCRRKCATLVETIRRPAAPRRCVFGCHRCSSSTPIFGMLGGAARRWRSSRRRRRRRPARSTCRHRAHVDESDPALSADADRAASVEPARCASICHAMTDADVAVRNRRAAPGRPHAFRRPPRFARGARRRRPASTTRAERDPEAFWAGFAARARVDHAVGRRCSSGSRRTRNGSSAASSTPASTASTATSATARRNKAAIIWEGEPGDRRTLTYCDLYREVCAVRQRAEVARRQAGRSRRALPAADPRAGDRDARLRAHRRRPQRRLRRLQRRVAARPHQRLAGDAARHRRRRLSPRPDRAAQADGRRGAAGHAVDRATSSSCSGSAGAPFPVDMQEGRDHWYHA